ncbi:hypothetical protein GUJ93_ZPchr0011g27494 [Zizania palustris]|uniref:Uncharacterized protein n=1 Tax=Zizania palustris TaxID=103762 RepID=A0A8J5WMC9_ZIZPA|nr:hypothetical protein GUJ93_ZPchr0011g27494 [Zizania palustris]
MGGLDIRNPLAQYDGHAGGGGGGREQVPTTPNNSGSNNHDDSLGGTTQDSPTSSRLGLEGTDSSAVGRLIVESSRAVEPSSLSLKPPVKSVSLVRNPLVHPSDRNRTALKSQLSSTVGETDCRGSRFGLE